MTQRTSGKKVNGKLFSLTVTAVFSAIVVVIQTSIGVISVGPVNLNFVLIPITLSAILFGYVSGMITGAAFGITVFIQCLTGSQGVFGSTLVEANWFFAAVLNIGRGVLVGFAAALVYKLLKKHIRNEYVPLLIASAVTPIVNTGFFILCYWGLFNDVMYGFMGDATNVFTHLFIGIAGINFVFEFVVSAVVTPPVGKVLIHSLPEKK